MDQEQPLEQPLREDLIPYVRRRMQQRVISEEAIDWVLENYDTRTNDFAPYAEYDGQADAIYIHLTDAPATTSKALDDYRLLDLSAEGAVVGVEFLGVSAGVDLSGIPFEKKIERLIEDLQQGIKFLTRT